MTAPSPAVPAERTLESPAALERLIREIVAALDAGELAEASDAKHGSPWIDIRALLDAATWPDIIDAEFVDQRGGRYHLFIDTYHGAGGRWSRMPD